MHHAGECPHYYRKHSVCVCVSAVQWNIPLVVWAGWNIASYGLVQSCAGLCRQLRSCWLAVTQAVVKILLWGTQQNHCCLLVRWCFAIRSRLMWWAVVWMGFILLLLCRRSPQGALRELDPHTHTSMHTHTWCPVKGRRPLGSERQDAVMRCWVGGTAVRRGTDGVSYMCVCVCACVCGYVAKMTHHQ